METRPGQVKIASSILASDFSALGEAVRRVDAAGTDWIHLDVMDGHFVPNLSFGPPIIQALRPHSRRFFDAHLMVERPEDLLSAYLEAGVDSLTVHAEATCHLQGTLRRIRDGGAKAGVSLNPATPLCFLEEVIPDLDLVLLMTVNPGFGGQTFIPQMLDKIRRCREMLDRAGSLAELSVDGGIHSGTVGNAVRAGASVLVAGSAVFGHPEGLEAGIRQLRLAALTEVV